MARLIAAKCPNCGAGLHVPPAVEWVTCRFCQVSSFIQRERPAASVPPPPTPVGAPVIHVQESKGARWPVVTFGVAVAGAIALVVHHHATTLDNIAIQSRPVLFDVNGDGAEDPIFLGLRAGNPEQHLRALDANSGETLWATDDFPRLSDGFVALVADTLLVFRASSFRGLSAVNGEQRFEQPLPERADTVCEREGRWFLLTADKKLYAIDPASGTLSATSGDGVMSPRSLEPLCAPAWTTEYGSKGRQVRTESAPSSLDIEGMNVSSVVHFGAGDQLSLVVGSRRGGTGTPMLAAVRGTETAWKILLPASAPLEATTGDPTAWTLAAGRVYAMYERTETRGFQLASFVLSSGQRNWETAVPRERSPGSSQIAASDRHVFVEASGGLHAFSASDGRMLWAVGWGLQH